MDKEQLELIKEKILSLKGNGYTLKDVNLTVNNDNLFIDANVCIDMDGEEYYNTFPKFIKIGDFSESGLKDFFYSEILEKHMDDVNVRILEDIKSDCLPKEFHHMMNENTMELNHYFDDLAFRDFENEFNEFWLDRIFDEETITIDDLRENSELVKLIANSTNNLDYLKSVGKDDLIGLTDFDYTFQIIDEVENSYKKIMEEIIIKMFTPYLDEELNGDTNVTDDSIIKREFLDEKLDEHESYSNLLWSFDLGSECIDLISDNENISNKDLIKKVLEESGSEPIETKKYFYFYLNE